MRLVDRDQADILPFQRLQHALGHQPLGREIKQPRFTPGHPLPGGDVAVPVDRGIDGIGRHAGQPQGGDLILHQRDQRRDHKRETAQNQRRNLVAEGFSGSRRHHRQDVAARQ